jgi:hypothetical protein
VSTFKSSALSPLDSSVHFRALDLFIGGKATAIPTGEGFGGLLARCIGAFVDCIVGGIVGRLFGALISTFVGRKMGPSMSSWQLSSQPSDTPA